MARPRFDLTASVAGVVLLFGLTAAGIARQMQSRPLEGRAPLPLAPASAAPGTLTGAVFPAGETFGVVFDCSSFRALAPEGCAPGPLAAEALLSLSELTAVVAARHEGLAKGEGAALDRAAAEAERVEPSSLTTAERVALQNAALRGALLLTGTRVSQPGAARLARLVERLALPPEALEALGSRPDPGLERWLGPESGWTARHPLILPLLHESLHHHTRVFRAVRVARTRAVFGQLVAVDTAWRPHVTPLIGDLELRLGMDEHAPACVAHRDSRAARCGAPAGLVTVDPEAAPTTHTFRLVAPGRVGCDGCHREGSLFNLPDEDPQDAGPPPASRLARLDGELAELRDLARRPP